ncbi:gamma carbonic anhydrase family protein [Frankia sp. R82]|uniref:gamma carbonic anhydrase family protein n=1 Tax=Frankia sp. R82 TaxID=2950553 RepID=UPI0020435568|nr:gamma carbonic anhydrase family protein [Frankia sp. R82]MCM3884220.1 gamma carbonic anhydrase family protein [Frankia sp. R82]
MAVYALGDAVPAIDPTAYVHPDATVIGSVTIGPESTVWPSAVLRGDYGRIIIGARSSIQDGTVIHATDEYPTVVGDDCTVGHLAHLEGCVVEDGVLIGSGSIVLHRVRIGRGALVGAGAVVVGGTRVPERSRALGIPATIVPGNDPSIQLLGASIYAANGQRYRRELRRLD